MCSLDLCTFSCNMLHFFLNVEGLTIFLVQLSDGREMAVAIKQLIRYLVKTSCSLLQSKGRTVENGPFLGWGEEWRVNLFSETICVRYISPCVPVCLLAQHNLKGNFAKMLCRKTNPLCGNNLWTRLQELHCTSRWFEWFSWHLSETFYKLPCEMAIWKRETCNFSNQINNIPLSFGNNQPAIINLL